MHDIRTYPACLVVPTYGYQVLKFHASKEYV